MVTVLVTAFTIIRVNAFSLVSTIKNNHRLDELEALNDQHLILLRQLSENEQRLKHAMKVMEDAVADLEGKVRGLEHDVLEIRIAFARFVPIISEISSNLLNAKQKLNFIGRKWSKRSLASEFFELFNMSSPC